MKGRKGREEVRKGIMESKEKRKRGNRGRDRRDEGKKKERGSEG